MKLVLLSKNDKRKTINKSSKKDNNYGKEFDLVQDISPNRKEPELKQSLTKNNIMKCEHLKNRVNKCIFLIFIQKDQILGIKFIDFFHHNLVFLSGKF